MPAYTPLPTSATDPPPRRSSPSSSNVLTNLLDRLPAPVQQFLESRPLKTRPVRLGVAVLAGFLVLSLLGTALHSRSSGGSVRGYPLAGTEGRGKWGTYASWLPGFGGSSSTADGGGSWEGYTGSGAGWRELPENEGLREPMLVKDEKTGKMMPPEVYPAALNPFKRANAAFVALVRNGEREAMRDSMRSVESRFNRRFGYPWVFLNDEPFDEDFKVGVMKMTRSEVFFAQIPKEHWSYPEWINQTYAADERQKMVNENVIYGGSESYRHMCRFNSGFFFKQKILESFDWYWRVEPGVELFCDIDYDVFHFMEANNKVYGFTIVLYEYLRTVETLWDATREFVRLHPDYIHPENTIRFLVDDEKKGLQDGDWNLCHFWSNFEIGSLKFWRSQPYEDYFKFLDGKGGFFYERWGDAPVHSFAAALFLPQSAIHNFYDISYRHNPYQTCPQNRKLFHDNGKCECYPENSFDTDGYSCMPRWWKVDGNPHEL
ncbi:Glycolipid 2-alpha-mannosyltransferase [Rhodotorula toruloides]|nr:Glycolipid 2-alpha-mannosyltransferase [Rhodotorula toruloides]